MPATGKRETLEDISVIPNHFSLRITANQTEVPEVGHFWHKHLTSKQLRETKEL